MVFKHAKQKQISFGYCDTETGQRVYPPQPPTAAPEAEDLLTEQLPPPQPKPFRSGNDMAVKLTSYPPLGQSTAIHRSQDTASFRVLAEHYGESEDLAETLDIRIWHNQSGEHDWAELPLTTASEVEDDEQEVFSVPGEHLKSGNVAWYTGELTGLPKHGQAVQFTLKYRFKSDDEWSWVKDTSGAQDGHLHYQSPHLDLSKHGAHELSQFFSNSSGEIKVTAERPETSDTLLYSLMSPATAAEGVDSSYTHHKLGTAVGGTKWMSLVRLWSPWLAPRQGKVDNFYLDKDGVLVSFLREDGFHVVCLAISGVDDVLTTFISEDNTVVIKARNDGNEPGTARVVIAVAEEFEVANAAVMYHARKVVQSLGASSADAETEKLIEQEMKPEWLEEWYDGLTYCTWNGLGQNLTAEKIYEALDSLKENDITITNLIIDDNWQSLSEGESQFKRGWTSFEANPKGFPDGMKATTAEIRKRHPNVNHIAVWHALLGYWGGICPDGEIAKKYKTIEVEKEPGVAGGKFHVVAAEDAQRMYDDFYRFLSGVGIDSVKTDAQFFIDLLLHAPDRKAMTKEYQDAWTLAHLHHLSGRAISCMSQSPQILFYEQLPTNKPRLLVRNSDDFFPEVEASHPWHIFCNAHNSLLTQHLNVLPDWDMFQTSHPWAGFHTAARCVSGGPIYFTDEPGKHDIGLINAMTAKTSRGKSVILRPPIVGRSLNIYNTYEAQALVKIGTYVGFAKTGTSILGLFNVTQQPISELIPLDDFLGTEEGQYVISSFVSGEVSKPLRRGAKKALVQVELGKRGWDVLNAYPLRPFKLGKSDEATSIAMMGLLGKMTGSAGVAGCDIYVEDSGRLRVWVSLKALGVLGLYVSDLEERKVDDLMVMIYGKPIGSEFVRKSTDTGAGKVLEVDVEEAWRKSGEDSGWSNEVSLEIFIR
ncbi:glycoside hydrolase family 36 protein [Polychaeton citri CBS 116435]|uniref:Glycoside hydrolase family 36 protein n=1 Tax=Polychaeton citri CBS 116435 TaxID=1314669 RepID=A0A9P4Q8S2_9PEZI|nr:glycoside hydrolase family 36 protein [Polychaeton citri CBS 116435]